MGKEREERVKQAIRFLEGQYQSSYNAFKTHGVYMDSPEAYLKAHVWPFRDVKKLIEDMYKTIQILEKKLEEI